MAFARYNPSPSPGVVAGIATAVAMRLLAGVYATAESPHADAATAKLYSGHALRPTNLRLEAQHTNEDIVFRMGPGHGDPVGPSFGGATPGIRALRCKTCAADLVAVARLEPEYESAFSNDGTAIFTVRRFSVVEVLRASSLAHVKPLDEVAVSMLGGAVMVNGHKIAVESHGVAELHDNASYLLFLKVIAGSNTFQSFPQSLYDPSSGSVVPITAGRPSALPAADARREIEAAAALCPSGESIGGLAY
jgi:hypothetical protein